MTSKVTGVGAGHAALDVKGGMDDNRRDALVLLWIMVRDLDNQCAIKCRDALMLLWIMVQDSTKG